MSETDLNPAIYRTFVHAKVEPKRAPEQPLAERAPEAPIEAAAAQNIPASHAVRNLSAASEDATLQNLALFSSWGTWTGLDLVFGSSHPRKHNAEFSAFRPTRKTSFVIGGISGGVGATSIATSLARLCESRRTRSAARSGSFECIAALLRKPQHAPSTFKFRASRRSEGKRRARMPADRRIPKRSHWKLGSRRGRILSCRHGLVVY